METLLAPVVAALTITGFVKSLPPIAPHRARTAPSDMHPTTSSNVIVEGLAWALVNKIEFLFSY
jgi:hypothetical protein